MRVKFRVDISEEDIGKIAMAIGNIVAGKLVEELPEEVRKKDAVATGYMARSFKYQPVGNQELEVVNEAPYSAVVEFGCVPHTPLYEDIFGWVLVKKRERGDEAEKAAWRIIKKIEREGYKPRYFARDYLRRLSQQELSVEVSFV